MRAISNCPRCQQQVSIPAGVDAADAVRCPLCHAEYPLREALALTPPELIPVAAVPRQPLAPSEIADDSAESAAEPLAEVNEAAAVAQQMPIAATASLRGRKTSWLGKTVGLVAGGLAGCLVALYLLAFLLGPQYREKGLPERVHIDGVCDFPLPLIHWLTTKQLP